VVRAVSASVERPEGGVRTVLVGLPQYSDLFHARTGYVQSASALPARSKEGGAGRNYSAGRIPPLFEPDYKPGRGIFRKRATNKQKMRIFIRRKK
jgi:hypothetical protein